MGTGRVAANHDESRDVLEHRAVGRTHGPGADVAELMNSGVAAENDAIPHMHVAGDGRVVGHDDVVTDDAIMGDMYIGHQQVVAADGGHATVLHGAPMQGAAFANDIVVADDQPGRLTMVFLVLAILADGGELENPVALADGRRPTDHHVRSNDRSRTNLDIRPDQGPGADLDVISQPCGWINDRLRVNSTHTLCSAQMISPEQASLPSTRARQANFQMPRLLLR